MTLNPILALELRARWRMNRSFALILGVAVALGGVALFIYQRAVIATVTDSVDPMTGVLTPAISNLDLRASAIGRELFSALAHANIWVWLLLAAASAATGIARERERGLLESLQLSAMSAPSQIAARLGANLLLLLALQLVLLPIYSVAFLMGGVSPGEIGQAFFLVAWAALLGSALGIWFSARAHRPTGALFGALGSALLFSGVIFWWLTDTVSRAYTIIWETLWLALLHPNALFWALTDTTPQWTLPPSQLILSVCVTWAALSWLGLWSATKSVNRTLPPPSWQSGTRWVEKLKARHAATPPLSARKQRASGALLADLPLDRFVRFSDPLLSREVKARFRLRRAGFWVSLVRGALFLGAILVWLFEVFWLFDAPSRSAMAPYGLRVLLYGGTLALGALAATSWTRERESGTWESLKLSLLTPREVLRAKWLSPLLSFAYYAAPLWILLPLGALFISPLAFGAGVLVVAAWLGLAVALGLWISWRVRNGTASIAWTTGILALLLVGLPWLNSLAGVDESLARWKYGVSGRNEQAYLFTSSGSRYRPDLLERFEADKANNAIAPRRGFGSGDEFYNWFYGQAEDAEKFKAQLNAWHPGEAMNRLFIQSDMQVDSSAYDRNYLRYNDPLQSVLWSVFLPAGATILLLVLLRRDVRREQMNS